jgi:hypothetical protein
MKIVLLLATASLLLANGGVGAPDADAEVASLPSTLPVAASNCTPIGRNNGGEVQWIGCPTAACGDPSTDPCQSQTNALGDLGWCRCQSWQWGWFGGPCACIVNLNGGLVVGFTCFASGCEGECGEEPLPGPEGIKFLFCWCP